MTAKELLSQLNDKAGSLYVHTLQRTYFRVFGRPVDRRFAIVGNARTGSNYLLDGLKSAPSIRMYHEIFAGHNRRVGHDFEKILATLYQPEDRATRLVGFKVFYNHLTAQEWDRLRACRELQIIHLTRRNRLRTVISLEIAFKTGEWTKSGKGSGAREKHVTLDPLKLVGRLEQIEEGEAAARRRFNDRPILEIVYEELVGAPQQVFRTVGDYLGVEGIDPGRIRLKRQNPEPLPQLIVNYAEVASALRNTRYEACLDD